ncbi:2-oxohept-3-enedioate hydratase [Jatrophihabitans endophyticus]|uniref:2-oxohept-3-enedioate hydratase n=1 Tax=Jatrophihabitans endophyticus TaxID=1206085 RepID=A0A1M5Q049_9ACTN|nr:hypothetical protein [Jatrophihabitans endophyticus]SHH06853.1 2-oxohept-3-enedioate hydratase [Jatrophihabitans endophyticus]
MSASADEIANMFVRSRSTGRPVKPPHCERSYDLQGAYYVQRRFVDAYVRTGERSVAGYKLSATSPASQAALGIPEPLIGALFSDEVLASGSQVDTSVFHCPMAEAEVAFVVLQDLPELCSRELVLESTALVPAIELADSRMTGWPQAMTSFSPQDIVADNAFSGRLVVGAQVSPRDIDVTRIAVDLTYGEEVNSSSVPAVIRVDPVSLIGWLSRGVHRVSGRLREGMVIASGAVAGPVPVTDGVVAADFGPLGTVSAVLSAGPPA